MGKRARMIGSTAETARKRPERPWTAARTMEVLRRCPLAIAQRLVHCAIALSTAVLDRVTKTMSVAPLLTNNLDNSKQKMSNLLSPAPPPYSWSLLGKSEGPAPPPSSKISWSFDLAWNPRLKDRDYIRYLYPGLDGHRPIRMFGDIWPGSRRYHQCGVIQDPFGLNETRPDPPLAKQTRITSSISIQCWWSSSNLNQIRFCTSGWLDVLSRIRLDWTKPDLSRFRRNTVAGTNPAFCSAGPDAHGSIWIRSDPFLPYV